MHEYHCRTNIDEGRGKEWPTDFVTRPQVGDYVASASGYTLKVASITHGIRPRASDGHMEPFIEVELDR
jgi:hypothetical protein